MQNNTFKEIIEVLKDSHNILIPLHFRPDGDSFGSCLAMYYLLKSMGKNPTVICADTMGSFYDLLPEYNLVNWGNKIDGGDMEKYDTLLALDVGDLARYTKDNKIDFEIPKKIKIVNIDHHPNNTYFGGVNYVDTTASSTSEIIYNLFREEGLGGIEVTGGTENTVKAKRMLPLGILSDTGFLKWNISPKLLRIVAELMETVDFASLASIMLYNFPKENKKYLAIIYNNLKFNDEKKFCYSKISYQEYIKNSINPDQVGGAVDSIKDIRGHDFCFTLNEEEPKRVHVSFRSQKGVDTAVFAKALGGGGHKAASGAVLLDTSLEEAEKEVLEVVGGLEGRK